MDFSDIVDRSRALRSLQEASASTLTDHIPRLERSLPQIDLESRRLAAATDQRSQPVSNVRALRLLSEYGYETDKIERTLQSVALLDAFEPVQPSLDTDLLSYLDSHNELIIAAAIDTTLRRAKTRSIASLTSSIDAEWDVAKRDLLTLPSPSMSMSTLPPTAIVTPASRRSLLAPTPSSAMNMGLKTPVNSIRNAAPYNTVPATPQAFASPFRQPRVSRTYDQNITSVNAATPMAVAPSASGFGNSGTVIPSLPPSVIPAASSLSIYHEIVRRVVYESCGLLRPPPSSSASARVATEFDDCLLTHQAPRGDHTIASKHVQHLHAVFNALRYIIGEQFPTSVSSGSPPSAHHFDKWSANEILNRVRRGSQRFLCLQFREDKMRREIEARPVEARRGGVPGIRADVRAFLNLVFDRGVPEQLVARNAPIFDGMPVWAFVYYFLRAGFVEEALQLVDDVITNGCMDSSVLMYAECLRAFVESAQGIDDRGGQKSKQYCLPNHLLEKLVQEYGVNVKRGEDPYQRVCFVIIARVDPAAGDKVALLDSDYALLFYSIEDYLWLRLSVARLGAGRKQARFQAEEFVGGRHDGNVSGDDDALPEALAAYELSMESVGKEIQQFGPSHFNAHGDSPIFYGLVLILTGQFKQAVVYLEEKARALTEATHIAFILYHYGVIRDSGKRGSGPASTLVISQFSSSLLEQQRLAEQRHHGHGNDDDDDDMGGDNDVESQVVLDYAGLIWRYASRLSQSDASVAAMYIFTIEDGLMRKELMKKLILESKGDYERLLGRHGGGGILAELWNKKDVESHANMSHRHSAAGAIIGNRTNGGADSWKTVVVEAGEEAERGGDRENALRLYEIAGVKAKMMEIHLSRVSCEVSNVGTNCGTRSRILDNAKRYLSELSRSSSATTAGAAGPGGGYEGGGGVVGEKAVGSLKILLEMGEFFDLRWEGRNDEALNVLERMRLLPKDDGEVVGKVMELGYGSGVWTKEVIERVPDMIVNAMEALSSVYTQHRRVGEGERTRLRKWARSVVNLSGMMRNLSADMSARLVGLEVVMN